MTPKPVDQLCISDLVTHPLWEYATGAEGEYDETYVVPTAAEAVPVDCNDVVYHVACDLVTATGKSLFGFVSICNGQFHDPEPIVVGSRSGEYICLGHPPSRRERAVYAEVIGVPYESLFPLKWTLRIPVGHEAKVREGEFRGAS